jgi:hypothetical protein
MIGQNLPTMEQKMNHTLVYYETDETTTVLVEEGREGIGWFLIS